MSDQDIYDQSLYEYYEGKKALESGDYENALRHLSKSTALHAHFATYSCMAVALTTLGRSLEAEEAIRMAYECNPKHSQTATAYAEMLAKRGDTRAALNILDVVIEHNSTYGPAKRLQARIKTAK